jgi:gliding motility-associated-like protein
MSPFFSSILLSRLMSARICLLLGLLFCSSVLLGQTAPLVTITSSPTSICVGEPITFTAKAANVGAVGLYQWTVNGNTAGTNSTKFSSTTIANGDAVQCVVYSKGANGITVITFSNVLTITVLSPPVIVQPDMAVCQGSTVVLDADVTGAAYSKYKVIDFANQFNFNIAFNTFGRDFVNCPNGNVTFNGVPFILYPWSDNFTGWNASNATGPDPRKLFIPVNEDGVVAVHLLANTYFGLPGPVSFVRVDFWANGSVVYQKDLVGDQDIRDFNKAQFTNQINNISTLNAWTSANDQNRLDNVRIQLPSPTRIDSIVVNDHGGDGQRMFILGTTVEKTPPTLKWSTGQTGPSITVNPTIATTYTVMATNGVASCSSKGVTISLTTPVVPSVTITQSINNVCPGTPINFTAVVQNGDKEPAFKWWVNGNKAGENNYQFTSTTLKNGDIVNCQATITGRCLTTNTPTSNPLTVTLLPEPTVDAGPDKLIHYTDQIQLNGSATGDIQSIQWSPATGLDNPSILNPIATPLETTKYFLTIQTKNTCVATDSVTIKVLPLDVEIPNAISPNHDGVNDTWTIKHLDLFSTCIVKIFNRYGAQIFTSTGYPRPWDGTYNNKALPAGTYYYIIDLKDGSEARSGYVVILR